MRNKLAAPSYVYYKSWVELLLFMPGLALFYTWVGSSYHLLIWLIILSGFYLLGFGFRAIWPRSIRAAYVLAALLLAAPLGMLCFGIRELGWLHIGLAAVCLLRGGQHAVLGWAEPLSPNFYWISLIFYFFTSIGFQFNELTAPLVPLVHRCGIFTLLLTLFSLNRYFLAEASLPPKNRPFRPAAGLGRANIALVGLLATFIFFVGLSGTLRQAWDKFRNGFLSLFPNAPERTAPPTDEITPKFPADTIETKPPALWLQIVDEILRIIATIGALVLLILALYFIIRKMSHYGKKLWLLIKKLLQSQDETAFTPSVQYYDEKKSIWDWDDFKANWQERFEQWLPKNKTMRWRDLATNEERVRYLFEIWVHETNKAGFYYNKTITPLEFTERENLEQFKAWVQLYYRVRYGGDVPNDDDVQYWKNQLKT